MWKEVERIGVIVGAGGRYGYQEQENDNKPLNSAVELRSVTPSFYMEVIGFAAPGNKG